MRAVLLESTLLIPREEYGEFFSVAHERLKEVQADVRPLHLTYDNDEPYVVEALAALGARTESVEAGLALVGFEGAASDAGLIVLFCGQPEGEEAPGSALWWLENRMLIRVTIADEGLAVESATHTWTKMDHFPEEVEVDVSAGG